MLLCLPQRVSTAQSVQIPLALCFLPFVEPFPVGEPLNASLFTVLQRVRQRRNGGLREAESAVKVTQR